MQSIHRPIRTQQADDGVVITGIGIITSTGRDRESAWAAVQAGRSGIRRVEKLSGFPPGALLGATVDIEGDLPGQLRNIALCRRTAAEALADSGLELDLVNRDRFAASIAGHMGDCSYVAEKLKRTDLLTPGRVPWCEQWLPNTACWAVASELDLRGPRLCNSTACASGTIAFLSAVRAIQDGQCDMALAGSSQTINPLFAAGFRNMRVLAYDDDPRLACRPFDRNRQGFVMGEGAAMFILERKSGALRRGAAIYAEVLGGSLLSEAHHVTNLNENCDALAHLITWTLRKSRVVPADVAYINAHGTGTQQNDVLESRGIRRSFARAADDVCVSANKSMLGHLVNASGSVELALTALALRDGFVPPTLNLTDPDPECDLDFVPLAGRSLAMDCALKLSIAFGGHMAAVVLRRWRGAGERRADVPRRMAA